MEMKMPVFQPPPSGLYDCGFLRRTRAKHLSKILARLMSDPQLSITRFIQSTVRGRTVDCIRHTVDAQWTHSGRTMDCIKTQVSAISHFELF